MSEDASYYRRQLDVASERDLDSLTAIDNRQIESEERMSEPSRDQVPMSELTARQKQRRHQMSQWAIEFQSSPREAHAAVYQSSPRETPSADPADPAGPADHTYVMEESQTQGHLTSIDQTDSSHLGMSSTKLESERNVRTPRYTSQHTNYEHMIDGMSPTDPFQGEYMPSGKKKLVSLNRSPSSERKSRKGIGKRSRPQISADGGQEDKDETRLTNSSPSANLQGQKPKKTKKKTSKSQLLGSTEVSTGTYTVDSSVAYENPSYQRDPSAKPPSKSHVKKRKKQNAETPSEAHDTVDCDSVKSNGTYTLPRNDSSAQLLCLSSASKMSSMWKRKKRQSQREITRVNTGLSVVKSELSKKKLADFVTNYIAQCECNHYVKSSVTTETNCKCGRLLSWHEQKNLPIDMNSDKEFWHSHNHTEKIPCDSFGEICFQGFGNESKDSPYLRLDPATHLDKVWTILTDYWLLPYPTLLISVTGGAKQLHLRPRVQTLFQRGLIHAATSTGAWIITGGTNAGVMKCVGEAVRDYLLTSDTTEQAKLVALGIATWGVIANKDALDGEGDRGLFPAVYNVEDVKERGQLAALDHNHTHFLLLDNGTEMKYGQEIEFRSALENYISNRIETGVVQEQSVKVPVVLLVLEGGQNTLKTVWESVNCKTPVVVIQGSGRAADIIAQCFRMTRHPANEDLSFFPSNFNTRVQQLTKRDFIWRTKDEAFIDRESVECVKQLREILQHRHLINVFNIDDADDKDIDKCILFALMKANKTKPESQLALALAWNRCDLARQKIFTHENRKNWQNLNLYDVMFTALVHDRVEFVQLFIDHGVDLKRLSTLTLWNLYANAIHQPPNNCAQQLIHWISSFNQSWSDYLCCRAAEGPRFGPNLLSHVGKVIQQLLGEQASNIYGGEKFNVATQNHKPSLKWEGKKHVDTTDGGVFSKSCSKPRTGKKKQVPDFEYAERELFIWAVLLNRRQLANLFWKMGKDHIGGALMASTMLKAMSKSADDDEEIELSLDLLDHANYFESVAVAVLSECYNKDRRMAHMLLVRQLDSWGKTTLLSLADSGGLMDFMEHTCCQTKLNIIWKGCMAQYTSSLKILVAIFLPVFVPTIKFTNNDSPIEDLDGDDDVPEDEPEEEVIPTGTVINQQSISDNRVSPDNKVSPSNAGDDGAEFAKFKSRGSKKKQKKFFTVSMPVVDGNNKHAINIISAIYFFYTAPVTKFFCNLVSYLTFLGIFSFFMLTDLRPVTSANSPSIMEYITWGWSATLFIEEIRQIFTRDPRSLKYKFRSWLSSEWNRLDLIMYLSLCLSIILRMVLRGVNFSWARLTYTITITLFFIRSMQYFYVNKNMGPKVIMIKKMLTDLMFFFLILVVFVVSFGVAYTANLYPNSELSWTVLKNVVYLPYWQMYGELFLEDVEGDLEDGTCSYDPGVYQTDEDLDRCPEKTWLVPILAAIYLLLTNILLVNLLIAMFSYTFERVQENSEKVWRFYRYSLIYEYYDRPSFVPPLIILTHLFRVVKYLCDKAWTGSVHKADAFRRILTADDNQRYTALERAALDKFATKTLLFEREKMDYKVQNTADRLEQVMAELESIKEQVLQETVEPEDKVTAVQQPLSTASTEPPKVQEDIRKLNQRLNHITDHMTMQSERLDSVLTLLVNMGSRTVGEGVTSLSPPPPNSSLEIHHLPGRTN